MKNPRRMLLGILFATVALYFVAGSSPLKACDETREDFSQLIGSSQEPVIRTRSEVREMGIVELKGPTLIVRNKAALEICGGFAA